MRDEEVVPRMSGPRKHFPRQTAPLIMMTVFRSQHVNFRDIPRLTLDSVLIGQFRDSVNAEIIGHYDCHLRS